MQAVKRLISGEDDGTAFMPYFCKFRDTKSARTWEIYEATRKKLEAFGASSLTFEDFDAKTLKRFDDFLAKSSLSPNARAIHLRNIRAVFNAAIADEITECYPFRKFKISYEPTRKRSVSVDTPIDTISLSLGHSYGSRITQVYINPDLRKADDAVRRLIDWVFRK